MLGFVVTGTENCYEAIPLMRQDRSNGLKSVTHCAVAFNYVRLFLHKYVLSGYSRGQHWITLNIWGDHLRSIDSKYELFGGMAFLKPACTPDIAVPL